MYVQIVTYNLNEVSEQDYIDIAHQVAAQFNSMPGLLAKVWLGESESNSFGAVYFWDDRESMERFTRSDLFEATYPGFANVASEGYGVYEHLTKATQPMLDILEDAQVVEEGWTGAPASTVEPTAAPPAPPSPKRAAKKARGAKKGAVRKGAAKSAPAAKKDRQGVELSVQQSSPTGTIRCNALATLQGVSAGVILYLERDERARHGACLEDAAADPLGRSSGNPL